VIRQRAAAAAEGSVSWQRGMISGNLAHSREVVWIQKSKN
jgi:hypothetical protein